MSNKENKEKKTLFLLDGHSLTHRAFYALPLLTNDDGEYTNAVFGFIRMLFSLNDEWNPDRMIITFDKKAPTFRHEEYEDYKGNRKKMPEELVPQIPLLQQTIEKLKIPMMAKEGYEADDLLGTLSKEAEEDGYKVYIVTGDRDALQLVSENVNVLYTRKGISDLVKFDLDKVMEKYELTPEKLIDRKGLMGDSSDNIPGVPGIGKKTALKLLKEFGTMEEILANIDKVSGKKRKENLHKYADQARMSYRLGKIKRDVPIDINFDKCRLDLYDDQEAAEQFEKLGFTSLLDRFDFKEEANFEDLEIEELKESDLKDFKEKIIKAGKIAVALKLEKGNKAISGKIEEFIFSIENEDKIYLYYPEDKINLEIKEILESERIEKIMLNAKEVSLSLLNHQIEILNISFEPLLAYYLLQPSSSLPEVEEVFSHKLTISFDQLETEKKEAVKISKLFELKEKLLPELEKNNLLKLYQEIELPLIKVLARMEYNGVKVDKKWLNSLSERLGKRLDIIVDKAHELAGEEFNLNSPKQLGEILFEKLGLPVIKRTKTGYSTNASVLEKLEGKHEIIPLISEYRELAKLKSTYIDSLPPLINEETGKIHTSFNQMVTATGRLSSTDPNLQNIPIRTEEGREIRKAFIPSREEMILLAVDYSQIELRVFAHLSGDEKLKEAFNSGADIHTETAAEVFEVAPEEVSPNLRRHAKVINFGIAYGMSAYGLSQDLDIPVEEAQEYIDKYFERFSGVKEYMDQTITKVKECGYAETMFGRRRYIPEINSSNYHRRSFAERTAVNTPIQGTAADIMKKSMLDVYDALKEADFDLNILLQVHDELVFEVNKNQLDQAAKLIKEKMENTTKLDVPLLVDLQIGENWRDKEDYEVNYNA
ncbi:DNA polymerase I [Halanaerobium saccharolyticum subsp. saccharolyticum DSM 6643]|uniref:DNA polymerase I n=1 Tax=Halanaerobium saccharolyticum subsp. saccharolyticum DSM 6643 TaxID=1293054 RepID=M5DYC9_9FIRM|nr:DNA polymerase I [Halanaerobium saccharolyticum]CCU78006.1 DNA polymerase I [Halanaerobium saccharolyticum subsp. saccharolyticum DSM 6643]